MWIQHVNFRKQNTISGNISNPNDLKNEETLDLSHEALQTIANTKIDNDYSHENINQ